MLLYTLYVVIDVSEGPAISMDRHLLFGWKVHRLLLKSLIHNFQIALHAFVFTTSTYPPAIFPPRLHIGSCCNCSYAVCLFCQVVILEHKSIICAGYSAVMHIHCAAEEVTVKVSIVATADIIVVFLCPLRKSAGNLQKSLFLSITLFRLFSIMTFQANVLNVYLTGLVIKL